jgi:hypothetical protein
MIDDICDRLQNITHVLYLYCFTYYTTSSCSLKYAIALLKEFISFCLDAIAILPSSSLKTKGDRILLKLFFTLNDIRLQDDKGALVIFQTNLTVNDCLLHHL